MSELLTVTAAAKRVKRSRRTIETWITDGLPVVWYSGVRYVRIEQLLAELRKRTLADPSKARELSAEQRRAGRVKKNLQRRYTDTTEN